MSEPDFDHVAGALERLGGEVPAAEVHGTLCGMICARGAVEPEAWLADVAGAAQAGDLLGQDDRRTLLALHRATSGQLADPELGFAPLLPPDEARLAARTEALGDWCQGFLFGLTRDGARDLKRLPEQSMEVVKDLVNIARVTEYEQHEREEDEAAFVEIVEYVRMGVLLINEELNPTPTDAKQPRLH
ncbi:UPF0149 family protein [Ectothiorhodospiraceae bacterium 2226]|nr:UPF0149 family protein [Ectothiorhodospiraceae bacterium 2226]